MESYGLRTGFSQQTRRPLQRLLLSFAVGQHEQTTYSPILKPPIRSTDPFITKEVVVIKCNFLEQSVDNPDSLTKSQQQHSLPKFPLQYTIYYRWMLRLKNVLRSATIPRYNLSYFFKRNVTLCWLLVNTLGL